MISAVKPGGLVLDLQVIPPNPVAEVDDEILCEIDGAPLLQQAAAAAAAVNDLIALGRLFEEAVDDHDVRKYYRTGADVVEDFADSERNIPENALSRLLDLHSPVLVRERCRLRRLRSLEPITGAS
jgi:hypothetical protein